MDSTFARPVPPSPRRAYGVAKISALALAAALLGVLIAGFWNYHLVDGFGRDVVAGQTIGNTAQLAGSFEARGSIFGVLFAAIAGLAATFTACNCVVFAMLPGLACSANGQHAGSSSPLRALGYFVGGVLVICAAYGLFIGALGPEGIEAYNQRPVRLVQAQAVFTLLGVVMLIWGGFELGLLDPVARRLPAGVRAWAGRATTKAGLLGVLVGLFAVGRPFPVFREFLTYAASAENPLYGAGVMMVQGVGQIAVMILLFALMVWVAGRKMMAWSAHKPHQPPLLSGLALIGGGVFFVYYWGLAFVFDIGRWGAKLGWY